MSSAGHVLDMISRIRQAKEQKQVRQARQQKVKNAMYEAATHGTNHELKYDEIPPEELARIKESIRTQARADRKKEALKSLLVLIPLLLAIAAFVVLFLL